MRPLTFLLTAVVAFATSTRVASESPSFASPEALLAPVQRDAEALTPLSVAEMQTAPNGRRLALLDTGAVLATLAREKGWVRVRLEGWVREDQLGAADIALRMSPSAADVRANPVEMKGRVIRWELQFISLQRADPLRKDLKDGEWYILARGPGAENALSYLVVPDDLLEQARSLKPLQKILVSARVRTGSSNPVGVPILEIETLVGK